MRPVGKAPVVKNCRGEPLSRVIVDENTAGLAMVTVKAMLLLYP
jgi:hypothetical protein